ncbi:hypothetical protein YC2023_089665 [Brassica napus]
MGFSGSCWTSLPSSNNKKKLQRNTDITRLSLLALRLHLPSPSFHASAVAEPAGSSSSSEVPIESQGSGSDSGSEYREPELRSSDPQGVDAEKPVVLTD